MVTFIRSNVRFVTFRIVWFDLFIHFPFDCGPYLGFWFSFNAKGLDLGLGLGLGLGVVLFS